MSHRQVRSSNKSNVLMALAPAATALMPHHVSLASAPAISSSIAGLTGGGTAAAATTGLATATVAAPLVLGAIAVGGLIYLLSRE